MWHHVLWMVMAMVMMMVMTMPMVSMMVLGNKMGFGGLVMGC